MPDLPGIAIGSHLFAPDQLAKVLSETIPPPTGTPRGAIVGTVDSSGAKVAMLLNSADGHWHVEAAVEHEWTGDNLAAGRVLFTF